MPFEPGQPKIGGRREGIPNRATAEFKGFWQQFLASTEYRDSLKRRMLDGKADHMERYVAELLYGRPRQEIDMNADKSLTILVNRGGHLLDVQPALVDQSRSREE